ncbi:amidohydrolase [Candidatus Micrarchaeota archaeon]|nr:amidohydrolase [Candidatus Micrarchaeota archaeon]
MSILIKDATILTPSGPLQGNLFIEENLISQISKSPITEKAEFVVDGRKRIVIPGLVNTHTHVSLSILRGYGENLPLQQWLSEKIWPAEAKQSPKDIEASALLSFCEMVRSGTTTFADMCIFDSKEVFDAATKVGMRGIISRAGIDFGTFSKNKLTEITSSLNSSSEYSNELVKPSVAAHAAYTCSEELLIKTKELATKKKLKYQIHVSETRKEVFDILKRTKKYPFEYLDSIGLMDQDSIFSHAGWLTKKEIGLAGKQGVSIASCPISNLKLATGGIAQLYELDQAGANVSLGTDSAASNNSLNMFETMKMASLLQKHHYWKADIIGPKKIFEFATINGAKAIGLKDAGTIEVGNLADLLILDRGPNLYPEHDLYCNLVYSAGPQNVRDVIVNGKFVMRDRVITTIAEEQILENANKSATNLVK